MASAPIPESLADLMRDCIASTFGAAFMRQSELFDDRIVELDTFTYLTRGRFSEYETEALLRTVSEVAHPYERAKDVAASVVFHEADGHHGWPSYRAAAAAPTDGPIALGISWRFTVPYPDTVIAEIENLWVHTAGEPLTVPAPRPEREPINLGETSLYLRTGQGNVAVHRMHEGVVDTASIDDDQKPRIFTEGGVELLADAEVDLLVRVMRALVDGDRSVLDEVDAYHHGSDPYMWTRDYGDFGDVHFAMPPGEPADWDVGVMQVDDAPEWSFVVVDMWTNETGRSDLSLEINFVTDPDNGDVRGQFVNLHML